MSVHALVSRLLWVLLSCLAWHDVGLLRRLLGFAKIPICLFRVIINVQHRNSSYGFNAESDVILYSATWLH